MMPLETSRNVILVRMVLQTRLGRDRLTAARHEREGRRPLVVGIGGTARAGSTSRRLLEGALEAAQRAGASTLLLGHDDLELPLYSPEKVERTEKAKRLVAEVARADGLIVSSPGYHGGPSGLVKNALDYLEDLRNDARPYCDGRAVGCIACASGWQAATTTLVGLRSIAHALRAWPTPLGIAVNTNDRPPDHELEALLEILGRQVVEFALLRKS